MRSSSFYRRLRSLVAAPRKSSLRSWNGTSGIHSLETLETRALLSAQPLIHLPFDDATAENTASDIEITPHSQFRLDVDESHGPVANFSGTNSLVFAHSSDLELGRDNGDFSVSFYVKLNSEPNGEWRTLVAKGAFQFRSFALFLHPNSNQIHYRFSTNQDFNEGGNSTGVLPVDSWTHVAVVKTGNQVQLFLNGFSDSIATLNGDTTFNRENIVIGKQDRLSSPSMNIDEFRVHTGALTSAEVRELSDNAGASSFYDFQFPEERLWGFDSSPAGSGSSTGQGNTALYRSDGELVGNATVVDDDQLSRVLQVNSEDDALFVEDSIGLNAALSPAGSGALRDGFSMAYYVRLDADADGTFRALTHSGTRSNQRTFATFLRPESNRIHYRISTDVSANEGGNSVHELEVGRWTHVAYVKDGSQLKLYIDGRLDSAVSLRGNVTVAPGPFRVGDTPWAAASMASFDQVGLYRFALTEDQMLNRPIIRRAGTIEYSQGSYFVDENAGTVTLMVKRTGGVDGEVSLNLWTTDLTAIGDGTDYSAIARYTPAAKVRIPDGETSATITIPIVDNDAVDGDRQFAINLNISGVINVPVIVALGGQRVAYVTILDNESTVHPPIPTPQYTMDVDGTLQITTTSENDQLLVYNEFGAYPKFVEVNGVPVYRNNDSVNFNTGAGHDSITIIGERFANDRLVADPSTFAFSVSSPDDSDDSYTISGSGFELLDVQQRDAGAIGDTAYLYDSPGNDTFVARPGFASLTNGDYTLITRDFPIVVGYSTDGLDEAKLYDQAANLPNPLLGQRVTTNDRLIATPTYSKLSGSGAISSPFEGYTIWAMSFGNVEAFATEGNDSARFDDSIGDDRFDSSPDASRLFGSGFDNAAYGFQNVSARSIAGGFDLAQLYDSAGDDHYVGRPDSGVLTGSHLGSDFRLSANKFESIAVFATQGNDTAELFDSSGNDIFVGRSNISAIFDVQRSYAHTLKSFDVVNANSGAGGIDEAQFYDSVGDDHLKAIPGNVQLTTGNAAVTSASGFKRVLAFSTNGGTDSFEQQAGLDYFFARVGDWLWIN